MKEESRSGSISDGGKQQFTKERRQTTRDTSQKVTLVLPAETGVFASMFRTVVLFTVLFTHRKTNSAIITKETYFPFFFFNMV